VSVWRDSEDEDGTRHYTSRQPFGEPMQFSLTRAERRRMSRSMMVAYVLMIVSGSLGYWVRQDAVGVLVGLAIASIPLMLVGLGLGIVDAARETRKGSTRRYGG
jgi:hypothetical protein